MVIGGGDLNWLVEVLIYRRNEFNQAASFTASLSAMIPAGFDKVAETFCFVNSHENIAQLPLKQYPDWDRLFVKSDL